MNESLQDARDILLRCGKLMGELLARKKTRHDDSESYKLKRRATELHTILLKMCEAQDSTPSAVLDEARLPSPKREKIRNVPKSAQGASAYERYLTRLNEIRKLVETSQPGITLKVRMELQKPSPFLWSSLPASDVTKKFGNQSLVATYLYVHSVYPNLTLKQVKASHVKGVQPMELEAVVKSLFDQEPSPLRVQPPSHVDDHSNKKTKLSVEDEETSLSLCIQMGDTREDFQVAPSTKLYHVFQRFASLHKLDLSTLNFQVNNHLVTLHDSPKSLDIKQGTIISCSSKR